MINYNNLWEIMKLRNFSKTELRKATNMSTSTFAKLSKNEIVSLNILIRLCEVLQCQISDICQVENFEEREKKD